MTGCMYLTPPDVAKRYGVKPAKVLRWIETGELEAVNVAERPTGRPRWRVSLDALQTFERRRSSRPEPLMPRKRKAQVPKYV